MTRTPPVSWPEMVADPVGGGMRILANQIADRDAELARLRKENAGMLGALKELEAAADNLANEANRSCADEALLHARAAIRAAEASALLAAERQTIGQSEDQ